MKLEAELPSIHRRLASPDQTTAIVAHMRLGDLCQMLQQRRLRVARQPERRRVGNRFVGMSIRPDD